jgi:ABC-type Mn2+/Zn2+ transport system permease subunit
LKVLYFLQLGPVLDSFNFIFGHFKTIGRQDITQILNKLGVELTFISVCMKAILMEMTEDITDMFLVL